MVLKQKDETIHPANAVQSIGKNAIVAVVIMLCLLYCATCAQAQTVIAPVEQPNSPAVESVEQPNSPIAQGLEQAPAEIVSDTNQLNGDGTSAGSSLTVPFQIGSSFGVPATASDWASAQLSETDARSSALNFNEFPKSFTSGLFVQNGRWAAKIGGYVKADMIHDFNAIDSTDFFDPATIEVGAPPRSTSRFHSRQTRLNMDTRWITNSGKPLRIMIETDFFGDGDTLRLRHAYGEYDGFIIGQTWSTLAHRAALPNTLDLVGDVASVGRRQTQIRYTKYWFEKRWETSAALEDSRVVLDDTLVPLGDAVPVGPDAIARIRYSNDVTQLQLAGVYRRLGFQPSGAEVIEANGGGLNGTGYLDLTKACRLYGGILWGTGIGSYRDLPDVAVSTPGRGTTLETLAWYCGVHEQWNDRWSSNLTYSNGSIQNTPQQDLDSIRRLQYLAVNLIWQPTPYTFAGTEFLYGTRENKSLQQSDANRIMVSFGFLFP